MDITMAIRLPQEARTVALVRTAVTNTLALFGIDDDSIDDIRLALSEACTNVIEHAVSEDEYEVTIQVAGPRCSISVANTGIGFDAASLAGMMPDPNSARGRGVAIMKAVMDTVEFTSSRQAGTILHLVRTLGFRADAMVSAVPAVPSPPPHRSN